MEEEWKDIPNLKGYQASNLGNVRSLNYDRTNKIRNLSKFKSKCGYLRVKITIGGIGKNYFVHRLVARAFLDNYNEKLQVNHKNGIKDDNRIENIEMVTLQENIRHSIETKLKPKLKRDKLGRFCGKEVM